MLILFHVKIKQACLDQTQKRCVAEIPFQNPFAAGNQLHAGVVSQSASRYHARLIIKSALVIKKNTLSPGQSAFSKFDPHVISNSNWTEWSTIRIGNRSVRETIRD